MKVKELKEELKHLDDNSEIFIGSPGESDTLLTEVEILEGDVFLF